VRHRWTRRTRPICVSGSFAFAVPRPRTLRILDSSPRQQCTREKRLFAGRIARDENDRYVTERACRNARDDDSARHARRTPSPHASQLTRPVTRPHARKPLPRPRPMEEERAQLVTARAHPSVSVCLGACSMRRSRLATTAAAAAAAPGAGGGQGPTRKEECTASGPRRKQWLLLRQGAVLVRLNIGSRELQQSVRVWRYRH
jgi:hypothetical protein